MLPLTRRSALGMLAGGIAGPGLAAKLASAQTSKVLVGCIEEDPPIMNPAISSAISNYITGMPCYSSIILMDNNAKIYPDLAETWELLPDGTSYRFGFRKGVVWHDGKPFSAADAKFTIETMIAKLHPSARGAYRSLAGVDAPDDHTLIVRMTQPTASYLSIPTAFGPILPRHLWEGSEIVRNPRNKAPVGTGPYRMVEYRPGDRIRYARNEKFYFPGLPGFDEFIIRIIPDASARVAAFERGDVDILYGTAVPSTEIARLSRMPGVTLKTTTLSGGSWTGNINCRNAPYSDRRVRQALAHAIDRKFIRDNILPGISWNQVGPLPPSSPLYNKALKDYEYDPRKAMALLDEAGFPPKADGTRFNFRFLWAPGDVRVTKMGEVIGRNLSAVGIKPVMHPLERSALNQRGYISGEFDMIIDSFALGPDPDVGVERLYRSDNILPVPFVNNSGYKNPEVDRLFEEQRVLTNFAERKAVYDRISEILWTDIPVMPIAAYTGPSAFRSSYVTDVFMADNTNRDNMMHARPLKP